MEGLSPRLGLAFFCRPGIQDVRRSRLLVTAQVRGFCDQTIGVFVGVCQGVASAGIRHGCSLAANASTQSSLARVASASQEVCHSLVIMT
jgi:hypothetical protein